MTTCCTQSGLSILVIGKDEIFGVGMEDGRVKFEFEQKLKNLCRLVDIIDGCAIMLDEYGNFHLMELFYETGQILATWSVEMVQNNSSWSLNNVSVRKDGGKIKFLITLESNSIGTLNALFFIDPLSSVPVCSFRHWIINDDCDEKNLPQIV